MFAAADINVDGRISLYEFCKILHNAQQAKYRLLTQVFRCVLDFCCCRAVCGGTAAVLCVPYVWTDACLTGLVF